MIWLSATACLLSLGMLTPPFPVDRNIGMVRVSCAVTELKSVYSGMLTPPFPVDRNIGMVRVSCAVTELKSV